MQIRGVNKPSERESEAETRETLAGNRMRLFFSFLSLSLNLDLRDLFSPKKHHHNLQQKELKEIDRDKASGVTVTLKGGSLKKLTGYVEGEEREKEFIGERRSKQTHFF